MRSLAHSVIGLAAILSVVACSDHNKDLLAPPKASNVLLPPGTIIDRPPLKPLITRNPYMEIVAGSGFTCVRKLSGEVTCWGYGFGNVPGPVYTPSGPLPPASQISAGGGNLCALVNGGQALCSGPEDSGQFGYQSPGTPITPPGMGVLPGAFRPVGGTMTFSTIKVGSGTICGNGTDGTSEGVWCAGFNGYVAQDNIWRREYAGSNADLSVGMGNVCAVYSGVVAVCWGYNNVGQAARTQQPVALGATSSTFPSNIVRASSSYDFTCADLSNNTVQCVGNNFNGTLGSSTFPVGFSTFTPQTVGSGQALHGVSVGFRHACALDDSGAAWCWGNNWYGELGDGTTTFPRYVATPQRVAAAFGGGAITFTALAAGGDHTCGIATDNSVYCWGSNYSHQLGVYLITPYGTEGKIANVPNKVL